MDGPRRAEDRPASNPVLAALDRRPIDEIHGTPDDRRELLIHRDQVEQGPGHVVGERVEEVQIALGPEVVANVRAEDGQLTDLPPATELGDLVHRQGDAVPRERGRGANGAASTETVRSAIAART